MRQSHSVLGYRAPLRPYLVAAVLIFSAANPAGAQQQDQPGGRLEANIAGKLVRFPVLKTDVHAHIKGDLATVTVRQAFANPTRSAVHASYLFPLNKDAAVFYMEMAVGEERIRADIQRVEEARANFEEAKKRGKAAALLTQHRPNMFTQEIANLMPDLPITVTMKYVQAVPRIDDRYELAVPLVVGPRFQPPGVGTAPKLENGASVLNDSRSHFGRWQLQALPAYPPVAGLDIPDTIAGDRISVNVRLDGGMPIQVVESPSHPLDIVRQSASEMSVKLASGRIADNRDFVLSYRLAGKDIQAGLLAHRDERGGFFSLLIEPPSVPTSVQPREVVLVLDCSGSMHGLPMEASKAFGRRILRSLRPDDWFRIIRFSDSATEFSTRPLPASPGNIQQGVAYLNGLRGSGGTMMTSGIRQALTPSTPSSALRMVVFLTDGYIGNEYEVTRLIKRHIGDARLFAFGVGTGVNRFLLAEMGRAGRGFARFMDPTEDVEAVAEELSQRLQSPVLTDIEIDWNGLEVSEINPAPIPDLFAGHALRIMGRYEQPGDHTVYVNGNADGRSAKLPLRILLPEAGTQGEAVALTWARGAVKNAMHRLSTPPGMRSDGISDNDLKQQVVKLGLNFSLVTQWTSFVATSEKVYNEDSDATPVKPVPLPQVKGVSRFAYGQGNAFAGNSAPEPEALLGFTLLTLLALGVMSRRKLISDAG